MRDIPLDYDEKPGTWHPCYPRVPSFSCPECGGTGILPRGEKGWKVDADGNVSPSINCRREVSPGVECAFHDFVKFVGWPGSKNDTG